MGRKYTIAKAENRNGEWVYQTTYTHAWWLESLITSEADWQARQEQIARETEIRQQQDADMRQHLEAIEPARSLYDTDTDFEWAYVQWANEFGSCGGRIDVVERLRWQFMHKNHWTVLS
jgi:hypothetical protein